MPSARAPLERRLRQTPPTAPTRGLQVCADPQPARDDSLGFAVPEPVVQDRVSGWQPPPVVLPGAIG